MIAFLLYVFFCQDTWCLSEAHKKKQSELCPARTVVSMTRMMQVSYYIHFSTADNAILSTKGVGGYSSVLYFVRSYFPWDSGHFAKTEAFSGAETSSPDLCALFEI